MPVATKPFAFILMPFSDEFADIYKLGIQAAATQCGVIAERVDEQTFSETILERIYRQIDNADFIIADMTGRNPNVFYEVGYAHARGKLCTLLTQSAADIPFDLRHHRHVIYNGSIQTLKDRLLIEIEWLKRERDKQTTSAFTIEIREPVGDLLKDTYTAEAVVNFVFDISNKSTKKSPEIEAIYLYTGAGWKFQLNGEDCPSSASGEREGQLRHFVKTPVPRLSPGAWAQIKVEGRKALSSTWRGDELKERYVLSGLLQLEIFTSEGAFKERKDVRLEVEEVPF